MLIGKAMYTKLHDAERRIRFYGYWLWNYTVATKGIIFDPRQLFDEIDSELIAICSDCQFQYEIICPQCEKQTIKDNLRIKKQIFRPHIGIYGSDCKDIERGIEGGQPLRASADKILLDACTGYNFCEAYEPYSSFSFYFCVNFYAKEWEHPLLPIFGEHNILAVDEKIKKMKGVSFTTTANASRSLGIWLWDRIERLEQFRSTEEAYSHLQSGAEFPIHILETLGCDNVDTAFLNKLLRQTKKCIRDRDVLSIG